MRPNVPYRSPRRASGSRDTPLFVAFITVFVVVIFIFGIDRLSGGIVRGYARAGGGALLTAAASATSLVTENGLLSSRRALETRNRELAAGIAMRDENAARFHILKEENEALRAMVNIAANNPDGVTAPIISSFSSSPFGIFTIGAGTGDGVDEGDIVLTPGGFVLGQVVSTAADTASVEAVFAPGKEVDVRAKEAAFTMTGRGGGNARAQASRSAGLAIGDAVVAPFFFSRPVGVIGNIESASSSASATLHIRLPVNLDIIPYVYVIPYE